MSNFNVGINFGFQVGDPCYAAYQQRMMMRQSALEGCYMPMGQPSMEEIMGLQGFYNGTLGSIQQLRYGGFNPGIFGGCGGGLLAGLPSSNTYDYMDPTVMALLQQSQQNAQSTIMMAMMMQQQSQLQQMLLMMLMSQQNQIPQNSLNQMLGNNQYYPPQNQPTTTTQQTGQQQQQQPQQEMTPYKAAEVMKKYMDLVDTAAGKGSKDGIIGKEDIEAVVKNQGFPDDLRKACQYLLDNPSALEYLDTAAGVGSRDGKIGMQDLEAAMKQKPADVGSQNPTQTQKPGEQKPMDAYRAAELLKKYFDLVDTAAGKGDKDGIIGMDDLVAVGNNTGFPEELKQACKFLVSNPSAMNYIDTAANKGSRDGKIGKDDLDAALTQKPADVGAQTTQKPEDKKPMDPYRAGEIVKKYFTMLDTAAKTDAASPWWTLGIGLLVAPGHYGKPDGKISLDDIKAVANDAGSPADLREACQYLVNNPAAFQYLDTAAGKGSRDEIIGMEDLDAAAKQKPAQ